jgi:hypothetical protein
MRIVVAVAFALFAVGCTTNSQPDMTTADLGGTSPRADLAEPAGTPDLSQHSSTPPADMAMAASRPDLEPACGAAVGQMCCPHTGMIPDCQHRDVNNGQIIGCDQDLGACIYCGAGGLPCCPGNVCYGGTTCNGPTSAQNGYCS